MKDANIKSKAEAAQRLIDGEVFYYGGVKIFFSADQTPPFRYGGFFLKEVWSEHEKWQIKSDWRDEVSKENPIPCWVWDDCDKGEYAKWICSINELDKDWPFEDNFGTPWKHAKPIKPEECWQRPMKIQEQIPENLPEWAEKAIKNGVFFKDAIAAVEDRNRLIREAIGYTMAAVCTNMESGFDPRKMKMSSLQKHTVIALGIEDTFYT